MASTLQGGPSEPPGAEVCSVVVVYEDVSTRDFAVELCNHLARSFAGDLQFDFVWLGSRYLSDPEVARQTALAAAAADLILVLSNGADDFTVDVKAWFERWVSDREPGEAALVLAQLPTQTGTHSLSQDSYLRLLAMRARLDYLPLSVSSSTPPSAYPSGTIYVSPETRLDPAGHDPHYSSGWGIND